MSVPAPDPVISLCADPNHDPALLCINGPATTPAATGTPAPDVCLSSGDQFNPGAGTTSRSMQPCVVSGPAPAQPVVEFPAARVNQATVAVTGARSLPSTGTTSAPVVGGASLLLTLGLCLVAVSRRFKPVHP